MLNKIIRVFYLTFGTLYGLNAVYVFFFTSSEDENKLFGFWETNRWVAGLVYLLISFVFLNSGIAKSKN
jgi:hypothetical protein